jgi:ubiquinone/menaquinone biosynthesis C-methylase UbiE
MSEGWQLGGHGPEAYEKYLVPAFFAACAERLLNQAPVGRADRVLDVACGTGVVSRQAAARVGPAGTVIGVDVNEAMIAYARQLAPTSVDWRNGDAASLPITDESVDVVCCQQGLQFFSDRTGALREIHRVLVPGGRLALITWRPLEHNPFWGAFVDVLERNAGTETADIIRAPFAGPSREEYHRLLQETGFRAVHARIEAIPVRFSSALDFLREEVAASPLVGPVGALDRAGRDKLAQDAEETLRPYADDDGLGFSMEGWLVTARADLPA